MRKLTKNSFCPLNATICSSNGRPKIMQVMTDSGSMRTTARYWRYKKIKLPLELKKKKMYSNNSNKILCFELCSCYFNLTLISNHKHNMQVGTIPSIPKEFSRKHRGKGTKEL